MSKKHNKVNDQLCSMGRDKFIKKYKLNDIDIELLRKFKKRCYDKNQVLYLINEDIQSIEKSFNKLKSLNLIYEIQDIKFIKDDMILINTGYYLTTLKL